MKRKSLGILMSILMIISMVPSFTFAADLPFTDVSTSAWYYSDVKTAYDTGLINGMDATTFAPESNMTYAQAVKLAACMNQKYSTGSVTLTNGSTNWWDSYTAYAKEKNIINKDYDWNSNATRAGYVEIFAKALPDEALKSKNRIADGYIPDVTMVHPQATAIYKLYRAGILTGMDKKGTFEPDSNIKRSEVSAILKRMMNESARKELTLGPIEELKEYTVIFNKSDGSAVAEQKVKENGKVVKPEDPVREGYTFSGWYQNIELTTVYDFTSAVTRNLTLYAKWTSDREYTITFDTCGGSAVAKQTIKENEKATKPADPTREGYIFAGWYKDKDLTYVYNFTAVMTGDLTLYAKWKKEYKVTFESNGGSAVAEQMIEENKTATKPSDPTREGYSFDGWYTNSGLTRAYNFMFKVTDDLILYAKWKSPHTPVYISDSWEQIIASVNDGTYKDKYWIGDTKMLDLGSRGAVMMQIAAFDADELADGSGKKAAITWISKQLMNSDQLESDHWMNPLDQKDPEDDSKYKIGSGSIGGWEYSEMRSWLKESVKPLIPETVRNAIKPVVKYSNIYDTSGNIVKDSRSKDDLWIPSFREVYGSTNSDTVGPGSETTGPVYKDLFQSDYNRMIMVSGTFSATLSTYWWLRSAFNVDHFYIVDHDGSFYISTTYYDHGVVIGFCL